MKDQLMDLKYGGIQYYFVWDDGCSEISLRDNPHSRTHSSTNLSGCIPFHWAWKQIAFYRDVPASKVEYGVIRRLGHLEDRIRTRILGYACLILIGRVCLTLEEGSRLIDFVSENRDILRRLDTKQRINYICDQGPDDISSKINMELHSVQ